GRIFCPVARDPFPGKYIESAELVFEKGKLDLDRTKAAKGGDEIVRSFKQCLKVDQQTRKRIRTLNLAEIGIGCNPRITKVIGYVLTDEKIIGSAHVAFGDNFTYGGTSRSVMHWDFVTIPRVTMVARIDDGSERVVIDGGRIRKG
ncbi:MAG: aminopeptidase, partial [Theionarchaea archaeon]|nr:aminopeptidase [Theionarchaea archaeon]